MQRSPFHQVSISKGTIRRLVLLKTARWRTVANYRYLANNFATWVFQYIYFDCYIAAVGLTHALLFLLSFSCFKVRDLLESLKTALFDILACDTG